MANSIISAIMLVAEVTVLVVNIKRYKLNKRKNTFIQIFMWLLYMIIGQPYKVIDYFMTTFGLRIQDTWWTSIIFVFILYVIGLLADTLINKLTENSMKNT